MPTAEQPSSEESSEPSNEPEDSGRDPSTATYALLNASVAAEQAGDLPKAIRQLERAIRIEPKDASLWTRLANLYGHAQNTARARQYANKAISLAGERGDLKRAAWLVLADIEEQDGNFNEAAAIRRRFQSVRG